MQIGSARYRFNFHSLANSVDMNEELAPSSNTTRTARPLITVVNVLCILLPFCVSNDGWLVDCV
ncbi:hypothetical protein DERF_001716 [Dermatophagoides farinae]|uniref:Uncharacterized protein n=1 Tax=Dermatophagoides farinae TaxID=6954 RepID=A0A922I957_DERFA|nr:hypothetical protein DERF_001716 [Dermatophagoides farinae]